MNIDLRFTDKEITAWGGMGLMKRMLDHLGFYGALAGCGLPQPWSNRGESPRELRRLHYLREWSHEQDKQVFT